MEGIRAQLEKLVDLDNATLVNNFDWTKNVNVLDFLRDVGKHATINQMVGRESVRSRMESTNGISFTEFSYMLLQAYDFWWLHQNLNCELQIGGLRSMGKYCSRSGSYPKEEVEQLRMVCMAANNTE